MQKKLFVAYDTATTVIRFANVDQPGRGKVARIEGLQIIGDFHEISIDDVKIYGSEEKQKSD